MAAVVGSIILAHVSYVTVERYCLRLGHRLNYRAVS
jgi:hypothetical protein